jgi:hypothetical protein
MRFPAFPIIASFVLLAAPALAQTAGMTGNPSRGAEAATNAPAQPGGLSADTPQKIRQSLENSGFKNVQVMPEAYVIRAQAPDGSHVVMLLRPQEMGGAAQQGGAGSSTPPSGSAPGRPASAERGNTGR